MTTSSEFSYHSSDDLDIVASQWEPATNLRGIVQLAHGMGEHIGRYDELEQRLTEHGYAVFGQDHRGHGRTAGSADQHGHLGDAGWPGLVGDIGRYGRATAAAQMFEGARDAADPQRLAGIRHDLPVYIAVGELDPVNGQLAFVQPLLERYRQVLDQVEFTVYPGARHEILNETNRAEVEADLLTWLDHVAASCPSPFNEEPPCPTSASSPSSGPSPDRRTSCAAR